jgi:pentatricopeptide repeat protein
MIAKDYLAVQTLCMRMHAYMKQERYEEADHILLDEMSLVKGMSELRFAGDIDVMIEALVYIALNSDMQMN